MPTVSIIIPSYNCIPYLQTALSSAVAQTLTDYEIIVVDDGSTDNTHHIMRPYTADSRVRYVHQDNRGLPAARNTGARLSEAKYLAFLDADDALEPNALERMVAALEASGASWCLIDILKVKTTSSEVHRTEIPAGDLLQGILRNDFIRRAMFFRRTDFLEVGMYDENMKYREDWDINIRMFRHRKPFIYLPEPLYRYSWREGSMTTGQRAKILRFTERLLKKHHQGLAKYDPQVAKVYAKNSWNLARDYFYELSDYHSAIRCMRESLVYDFSLGRLFHPLLHRYGRKRDASPASAVL
jgi:glycosyltransferase involved in cell wall biosynthesis